jgi:hypothetical protein
MKKSIIVVIIIIVAAALVFFSIFWPLDKAEDLKGTIGGVEKAKKFRGEQMDASDILVDNEEFNTLIQSAEWQNAMKDEEFVAFLKSDDFKKYATMMGDMQKIVLLNLYFDTVKSDLMKEPELTEEVVKSFFNNDFQEAVFSSTNQDFQQFVIVIFSQDFQNVFLANLDNLENLNAIDFVRSFLASSPTFKAVFSMNMQKYVYSKDFEKFYLSQDYQNTIMGLSQDFQKLLSQDFQNAIRSLSQDFQKQFMSQDFQKQFMSQDFQKSYYVSQDFQKVILSQDFQAVLNSNFFVGYWSLNQDFQQNRLGAFQDYLNCPGSPF